jgi:hypothetical protein
MDPQNPSSWRRLPGPGQPDLEARARSRDHGLRRVRRLSNWTAVALVAATAGTAGYFARASHPSAQQPASVSGTSVSGTHSQAPGASTGQPCVTTPVAVSGGSGVTTTVPARSCAPGTGGGTVPAVIYVRPGEDRGD